MVNENVRKYVGGGIWSGHAHQDFGRESAGQTLEVRERKMQEGKEVHGKKGRGMWGSTLEERPGAGMLTRILGEKVRDKHWKYGNEGKYGKESTRQERVEVCGEVRWRRDLEQACSPGFWEGKCGELKKVRDCETRQKQNNSDWRENRKGSKSS